MKTLFIIIIVAVIAAAIAFYGFHTKHKISYSDTQLANAVDNIFIDSIDYKMPKLSFLHDLKRQLSCSHKEALVLYARCKALKLIESDGNVVSKLDNNSQSK